MDSCEYRDWLMRSHDGELDPAQQRELERHVAQCADCARELERLRALSRLLGRAGVPAAPPGMIARLHARAGSASDAAIVRICRPVAAAAAALLIGCVLWLWHGEANAASDVALPAEWELAAATLETGSTPAGSQRVFSVWMVDGLSGENGQ